MMRPRFIAFLLCVLVLLSGCIQPQEEPQVSKKAVSEEWKPDGIVGENEYSRSMVLSSPAKQGYSGGEMEISWKNDRDYLYMALKGKTDGWLSIGFEPTEWMKDADTIMGWVDGGKADIRDEYITGNYGPHVNDTDLGGTNDILVSSGSHEGGYTVIEFKRKLDTGDKFDKAFVPGQGISMIWATADRNDHDLKHNVAFGEGILVLEGGEETPVTAAALSQREMNGILFIWEEEKVARDLYRSLYNESNLSIFVDLARSEQNHMDMALALMDKYGLQAPVSDEHGLFSNQTLIGYYDELLAKGRQSPQDALEAAAAFEEISIVDLEKEIAAAEAEDVRVVYEGLLAGSRKHLRSYVRDLQEQGIQYSPQYLSQEEFEETIK
jgi:hypothetical protein